MEIIDNNPNYKIYHYFIECVYNNKIIKCVKITKIRIINFNKPIIKLINQLYKSLKYKSYITYSYDDITQNDFIIIYFRTDNINITNLIPNTTEINNIIDIILSKKLNSRIN